MRNTILQILQTSELSRDNVKFDPHGVNGDIAAGSSGTIDLLINDDSFLNGGQLIIANGTLKDTCQMQVYDKDQIYKNTQIVDTKNAPLFAAPGVPLTYGMIPTYPLLDQFSTNIQIAGNIQRQEPFNLTYVAKVLGGMYLRLVYASTGTLPVTVGCNFYLHKALY